MTIEERREKMLQLVSDWQQSGQSQKAFAEAHGIKLFTFRYWIQKQREQSQHTDAFLQLGAPLSTAAITIRYPNGTELQLPANTPVGTIKGLLSL
jgi:transposase-like protein